jgi:hypothetical protein
MSSWQMASQWQEYLWEGDIKWQDRNPDSGKEPVLFFCNNSLLWQQQGPKNSLTLFCLRAASPMTKPTPTTLHLLKVPPPPNTIIWRTKPPTQEPWGTHWSHIQTITAHNGWWVLTVSWSCGGKEIRHSIRVPYTQEYTAQAGVNNCTGKYGGVRTVHVHANTAQICSLKRPQNPGKDPHLDF